MLIIGVLTGVMALGGLPGTGVAESSWSGSWRRGGAVLDEGIVGATSLAAQASLDNPFTADARLALLQDGSNRDPSDGDAVSSAPPARLPAKRYGSKGSWRWNVMAGGAGSVNRDVETALIGYSLSYFFVENFSWELEFNGLYFAVQPDNALAANVNLLLRWHFASDVNWTVYVEAGAGVMLASQEVPQQGSNFNFTPQAGFGFTVEIDTDTRLLVGLRWHHISNGSLSSENPGMDSILAYAGVSFPF